MRSAILKGTADYFDGWVKENLALSLFNVLPQDCWMIGDNLVWDVQAPQALGIHAIWHDYRRDGLPQNSSITPNHVIYDVRELLPLLVGNTAE